MSAVFYIVNKYIGVLQIHGMYVCMDMCLCVYVVCVCVCKFI